MSNIHRLSPETPSLTIEAADITTGRLASILASAVIENDIDEDGHIYVTDGLDFPVWSEVDDDRKFLCFFTNYNLDDEMTDLPTADVLAALNDLNGSIIVSQFNWKRGKLWGHYWMTFDTRLDPRHFIKMLRSFSSAFVGGARQLSQALEKARAG